MTEKRKEKKNMIAEWCKCTACLCSFTSWQEIDIL